MDTRASWGGTGQGCYPHTLRHEGLRTILDLSPCCLVCDLGQVTHSPLSPHFFTGGSHWCCIRQSTYLLDQGHYCILYIITIIIINNVMERLWSAVGHDESVAHSGSRGLDLGVATATCFAGGWLALRLCGMPISLQVAPSTAAWRAEVSPSHDLGLQRDQEELLGYPAKV